MERLCKIVVGTSIKTRHSIGKCTASRQHQNRNKRTARTRFDRLAQLDSFHIWKHPVKDDQIKITIINCSHCSCCGIDSPSTIAGLFENQADKFSNTRLVFDNQHDCRMVFHTKSRKVPVAATTERLFKCLHSDEERCPHQMMQHALYH